MDGSTFTVTQSSCSGKEISCASITERRTMGAVALQAGKGLKEGAVLVRPMHDAAGPADARVFGHAARSGSCSIALSHCPTYRGRACRVLLPRKDIMQRRMPIWSLQYHQ